MAEMSKGTAIHPDAFTQYANRSVLVVGAARSGLAAAELLLFLGARVILNDVKPRESFHLSDAVLSSDRCELHFESPAEPLLPKCDTLLISPGIPLDTPFVVKAVEQGKTLLGELDFAASCTLLPIVAVSGTNGKTTTVSLLGEMFKKAGRVAHVAGNIGYPLSAAVLNGEPGDILVTEVSSFQLETCTGFHPQAAALINISPDHLDRHKTMDTYIRLKQRLFQHMDQHDTAVLNYDDAIIRAMSPQLQSAITWFSRIEPLTEGMVLSEGGIAWCEQGETRELLKATELRIPGAHNVENALAASAIAHRMGVPFPVIAYTLKSFKGVEHRIEDVASIRDVRFLNDSKGTNPDSTIKAVQAMTGPTVLILGGYDKGTSFRELGIIIRQSGTIHHCVLLGQTAEQIREALHDAGFVSTHHAESLQEAVKMSLHLAEQGGTVLFSPACASFDMFNDYEERGRAFKKLVLELQAKEG